MAGKGNHWRSATEDAIASAMRHRRGRGEILAWCGVVRAVAAVLDTDRAAGSPSPTLERWLAYQLVHHAKPPKPRGKRAPSAVGVGKGEGRSDGFPSRFHGLDEPDRPSVSESHTRTIPSPEEELGYALGIDLGGDTPRSTPGLERSPVSVPHRDPPAVPLLESAPGDTRELEARLLSAAEAATIPDVSPPGPDLRKIPPRNPLPARKRLKKLALAVEDLRNWIVFWGLEIPEAAEVLGSTVGLVERLLTRQYSERLSCRLSRRLSHIMHTDPWTLPDIARLGSVVLNVVPVRNDSEIGTDAYNNGLVMTELTFWRFWSAEQVRLKVLLDKNTREFLPGRELRDLGKLRALDLPRDRPIACCVRHEPSRLTTMASHGATFDMNRREAMARLALAVEERKVRAISIFTPPADSEIVEP